jgi:(p)ppGpp synthase/HD superfamily hydrolase
MSSAATNHPLVVRARDVAKAAHDLCRHLRSDGTPYWTHPERVVNTLAGHQLRPEVLAAAWLHDVAEDCCDNEAGSRDWLARFEAEFGPDVARLVTEVTNYFIAGATMEEKQARLREHARTMSGEAKWIKLADRWDNISGMVGWPPEKRRRYGHATLLLLEALKPWPEGADSLAGKIVAAAHTHETSTVDTHILDGPDGP